MTQAPKQDDSTKTQSQSIADRLRTVSWSNYSYPAGVANRFVGTQPSRLPQELYNHKDKHV